MHKVKTFFRKIFRELNPKKPSFQSSETYWEDRYKTGGNSGRGSYNELASYKAEIINNFVRENDIQSVVEHGCGDGNQLAYGCYQSYIGFDVSPEAVSICRRKYKNDGSKIFKHTSDYNGETADLALSLDVIYHLVENDVFDAYMKRLFASSKRFVLIYSSDIDDDPSTMEHVRHRNFSKYITEKFPGWRLIDKIKNRSPVSTDDPSGSHSDFFIYKKESS